ncbi:RluA family pseudouridine synthase [Denitrobaculum tricleocarpae]|uniref:RluA family pseudouridine synthase n=1 Tax=Denitrobaculum tricleocarpae TaxID=2591009 RepID=UPI001FE3030C|nr:RluA family pseudouridine synthase [Denitrobaculum tricleocarpae]
MPDTDAPPGPADPDRPDSAHASPADLKASGDPDVSERHAILVDPADKRERVDRLLVKNLPTLSRSRLQGLITTGQLSVDGKTIDNPAFRVKPGQKLLLEVPPAVAAEPEAQQIDLDIVFEDPYLIVIDKPAGMVVHPAPGNLDGTLVNALIGHCGESLKGIGGVRRPGIVHRLDKDTSGLIVAAKTEAVHQALTELFAARDIERAYQAVIWGAPSPAKGEIEGNIGRSPRNRKKMAVVRRGGKSALTRYQTLKSYAQGAVSLIECRLMTGRTHQIRVHLTEKGHPLVGDPVYGRVSDAKLQRLPPDARLAFRDFRRQALHARILGFKHPITGKTLKFESKLPPDIKELISSLEPV